MEVTDEIITELANERVGTVVLDYAGAVQLAEQQLNLRPDGVHPNMDLGVGWIDAYFGPVLTDAQSRALDEQRTENPSL